MRTNASTDETESYGALLLPKIASASIRHGPRFSSHLFVLLLREFPFKEAEERERHLGLILSSYVLLTGMKNLADASISGPALAKFSKYLTTEDLRFILSFLREAMLNESSFGPELVSVILLSAMFVENAPEGV